MPLRRGTQLAYDAIPSVISARLQLGQLGTATSDEQLWKAALLLMPGMFYLMDYRAALTLYRLERLENALDRLLERIGDDPTRNSSRSNTPLHSISRNTAITRSMIQSNDSSEAPVMIIRDLAAEAGAQSPGTPRVSAHGIQSHDIISGGLLSFTDAVSLLAMYVKISEVYRILDVDECKFLKVINVTYGILEKNFIARHGRISSKFNFILSILTVFQTHILRW
jgi:hypothetical protein